MKKSNYLRIAGVTLLILVVPLVAMWPLDEFDWGFADFVIMGSMIFGTGLALDWVVRLAIAWIGRK